MLDAPESSRDSAVPLSAADELTGSSDFFSGLSPEQPAFNQGQSSTINNLAGKNNVVLDIRIIHLPLLR
jgi:hypothetical protein